MDTVITAIAVFISLVAMLSLGMAIGEAVQDYTYNYYKQIGESIMSTNNKKKKANWDFETEAFPAVLIPTIGIARDTVGGGRVEWTLFIVLPFIAFAIVRTK